MRREPPVASWCRVTARPLELGGGVELPAGAELLLILMGSGSDPAVFDSPGQMVPGRANIRHHLALGVGRHRCPGAAPARTEAAVAPTLGPLSFRAPLRAPVVEPSPTG
ncbi:cytochrome P450 [Streptomyces sp. NPDC002463]|uniref:cytochrome P450 n=1 Tax=Streptomyces sp. NPDC002463 TaxID=3364645 RepID=UPI0036A297A0